MDLAAGGSLESEAEVLLGFSVCWGPSSRKTRGLQEDMLAHGHLVALGVMPSGEGVFFSGWRFLCWYLSVFTYSLGHTMSPQIHLCCQRQMD